MTPLALRNPKVQRLRRLVARRRERDAEGVMVVEGPKLVAEAFAAGLAVEAVYVDAGAEVAGLAVLDTARAGQVPVEELGAGVMARVSDATTPQPVLAVVARPAVPVDDVRDADFVVVCVELQDPGNAGTVVRTAEAFGAGAIICCNDTVDAFSPKCVRASAGSLFRVPVVTGGAPLEVLERLGGWGLERLGAVAHGGRPVDDVDLTGPVALVLGNESHGLRPEVVDVLDGTLTIPLAGRAESLNVGMAAAVLCAEVARQRRAAGGGRG